MAMTTDGPKPPPKPAARPKPAAKPVQPPPADDAPASSGAGEEKTASFARLGEKIAALSKELAAVTQAAGAAAPRKLELEAASAAFKSLTDAYAKTPEAFSAAQMDLFARQSGALHEMAAGVPGSDADRDGRFSDPAWSENPFFDFVRRTFLASSQWAEQLAWNAPGLSELERRRAAFFVRQASAAMAPSNMLTGNPRALKALFESDGQSVQRGFANLQADMDAANGRLSVMQTDADAFVLGENIAATPGEVVLKNPLIELIRYLPSTDNVRERPLLIFPPWINKYYVLDLTPKNSLVAWLRDQGFTVYMVSWRSADDETKNFDWNDYLKLGGRAALDFVHDAHGAPVNAAGYCVGGALLSVLAARLATEANAATYKGERLASISLLAAQTDFSEPGDLGLFIDTASIDAVAHVIDEAGGVMPGEAMRDAFNLLRPEDLIWRYVEERYLLGQDPKPFDLLYWNGDQTNLPGPLHLSSLHRMYIDNALATGGFEVEGAKVDLGAIKIPAFIHAARKDHISPFASVYKGVKLFGGEVTFLLADSGHIAGVVNPPAANKYRHWTGPEHPASADNWLANADEHSGSWWPLWAGWLHERSGEFVAPPRPVKGAAPAPGSYVRETLASIRGKKS
jgi:polyhydroxyalkanoate synthase